MSNKNVIVSIYRYNPEYNSKPYYQDYTVSIDDHDIKLLNLLVKIKDLYDDSLSFRRSCREGVCGSDAININGRNGLACLTNISDLGSKIILRPIPGLPVVRDLIVDMTQFFNQYDYIKPYVIDSKTMPERERLQSPEDRDRLNGVIECILCACCSTSCPSYWWHPESYPKELFGQEFFLLEFLYHLYLKLSQFYLLELL